MLMRAQACVHTPSQAPFGVGRKVLDVNPESAELSNVTSGPFHINTAVGLQKHFL